MSELAKEDGLLVACLCVTLRKTCADFRGTFDELAAANPDAGFQWLLAALKAPGS